MKTKHYENELEHLVNKRFSLLIGSNKHANEYKLLAIHKDNDIEIVLEDINIDPRNDYVPKHSLYNGVSNISLIEFRKALSNVMLDTRITYKTNLDKIDKLKSDLNVITKTLDEVKCELEQLTLEPDKFEKSIKLVNVLLLKHIVKTDSIKEDISILTDKNKEIRKLNTLIEYGDIIEIIDSYLKKFDLSTIESDTIMLYKLKDFGDGLKPTLNRGNVCYIISRTLPIDKYKDKDQQLYYVDINGDKIKEPKDILKDGCFLVRSFPDMKLGEPYIVYIDNVKDLGII